MFYAKIYWTEKRLEHNFTEYKVSLLGSRITMYFKV